ncbi:hypothetical protein [Hymenobacter sp. 5414T-23]|uniref:hypothetical protein n=1 Tax=Hymenobacter sp. 5414T-23 TaxID=2932252 RepID=UPI001FD2BBA0|nr:hypothetical protein [Hymenobacter sp. 5414T-23]UOQ82464.1 hypothetical protein MUN83_06765 [Hymenobacter sp. 5414T-23]
MLRPQCSALLNSAFWVLALCLLLPLLAEAQTPAADSLRRVLRTATRPILPVCVACWL